MGGVGSGRWQRYSSKGMTHECHKIDVRDFKRAGWLLPGTQLLVADSFKLLVIADNLIEIYRQLDRVDGTPSYPRLGFIGLRYRPCHLGGERPAFCCPLCESPAYILYLHRHSGRYACRRCARLSYHSQRQRPLQRGLDLALKLIRKIDPEGCVMTGVPPRPKGMHRAKYARLACRAHLCLSGCMPRLEESIEKHRQVLEGTGYSVCADEPVNLPDVEWTQDVFTSDVSLGR